MRATAAVLALAMGCLFAAALQAATTELPCPEPKPAFNYTAIDRTLTEPKYGSGKPAYRFLAFGPAGETIVALVADESKGTGSGVDTLYIDLNANCDLTEPGERFTLEKAQPMKKAPGSAEDLVLVTLCDWGKDVMKERKLDVPDPTLDYVLAVGCTFVQVTTSTKDGSWKVRLVASDGSVPWSTSRENAPVFRFGGNDFSLRNEDFVLDVAGRGERRESGVGRTLRPGAVLDLDGAIPYFAGSSPSVVFAQGQCWVGGGYRGLRAWIESGGDPPKPHGTPIDFREY